MGQQAGRAIGRMIHYGDPSKPVPGVFLPCCGRTVHNASEGHGAYCAAKQAEAERDRQRREALPALFEREPGPAQPDPTPENKITPPRAMTRGEREEKKRAILAWIREQGGFAQGEYPTDLDYSLYCTPSEARAMRRDDLRTMMAARIAAAKGE